jgi:hypothetical protein
MAKRTHYDVLGVPANADDSQIRSAYRKLVLKHHPDHSPSETSKRLFIEATEAYQVLNSGDTRREYDAQLKAQRDREASEVARRAAAAASAQRAAEEAVRRVAQEEKSKRTTKDNRGPLPSIASEVQRRAVMFSRGQYAEADRLAREILVRDARQPMPYAVLGDLARSRGNTEEALKQYALALQMDPHNAVYLQRYEELLNRSRMTTDPTRKHGPRFEPDEQRSLGIVLVGLVATIAAIYVALAPERSAFQAIPFVSSWTVGVVVMLFLTGVVSGASLSATQLIDRPVGITGRLSPAIPLTLISTVSYPIAALLYVGLMLFQRAFDRSVVRLGLAVTASTALLALAAAPSRNVEPGQVLLWGGNVCYIGAVLGWMVADSLRT